MNVENEILKVPLSESYEQNIPVALFITIHNIILPFSL